MNPRIGNTTFIEAISSVFDWKNLSLISVQRLVMISMEVVKLLLPIKIKLEFVKNK